MALDSPIGWLGLLWHDDLLTVLKCGYQTQTVCLKALNEQGPVDQKMIGQPGKEQQDLADRLLRFLSGAWDDFLDVQVDDGGITPFQLGVRRQCRSIVPGQTVSYGELAEAVGSPGAARAVGSAMAKNRIPLIVPCHRVLPRGGGLGGFSAPTGQKLKRRLLRIEGVDIRKV